MLFIYMPPFYHYQVLKGLFVYLLHYQWGLAGKALLPSCICFSVGLLIGRRDFRWVHLPPYFECISVHSHLHQHWSLRVAWRLSPAPFFA